MAEAEKTYRHIIERDWCKGCGICIRFCPKEVLAADADGKAMARFPDKCIGCRLCEFRCPDLAITVQEKSWGL